MLKLLTRTKTSGNSGWGGGDALTGRTIPMGACVSGWHGKGSIGIGWARNRRGVPLIYVLHSSIAHDFTPKALQAITQGSSRCLCVPEHGPVGLPVPLVLLHSFCFAQRRRHSNRSQRREAAVARTDKRGSSAEMNQPQQSHFAEGAGSRTIAGTFVSAWRRAKPRVHENHVLFTHGEPTSFGAFLKLISFSTTESMLAVANGLRYANIDIKGRRKQVDGHNQNGDMPRQNPSTRN